MWRTGTWGAALALFALLFGAVDRARAVEPPPPPAASTVVPLDHLPALKGDYFAFASEAVGRGFHVYVRLPEGHGDDPDARYPVVYLLDGDSLFPLLATSHLFLQYDEGIPDAIVVGIAYGSFDPAINSRGHDFSAAAADAGPGQGGADAFLWFLESELLPEVERRYQADPARRVLFGQSRGGYFVLYSAFVAPDLFWGRIASNPAFDPGRARFFDTPAPAVRDDLVLVVTSGERDIAVLRRAALEWSAAWQRRDDAPWTLHFATIPGGTHAVDSPNSYRIGMLRLFGAGVTDD